MEVFIFRFMELHEYGLVENFIKTSAKTQKRNSMPEWSSKKIADYSIDWE
jgi:hypothetical protein